MTRDELLAASREPNVAALLEAIRSCEGTNVPHGYRMLFGGELFDGFHDHPRRLIQRSGYSTTAAGSFQFLERTWDLVARKYALPDFSPQWQDAGAVALIAEKGALEPIRAGKLAEAIARIAPVWASLPGAPYGQPTRTMEFVARAYRAGGGTLEPQQPNDAFAGFDIPPRPPATEPVSKPMSPALVPVLLQILSTYAPQLIKLFGDKSKSVRERNVEAGMAVIEIAKEVAGTPTPAAAVEKIEQLPELQQQFRQAVEARWYELTEAAGGGIEGARAYGVKLTEGGDWRALGYGFIIATLSLLIVGGGGALIWILLADPSTNPEQRGMLIGAVVALISAVVSFFFGSSVSSRQKDNALVKELGMRE